MKKILLFLFLFPILSMSQGIMGDKTEFSRQDTLRGSITKERSWWDLNRYWNLNYLLDFLFAK